MEPKSLPPNSILPISRGSPAPPPGLVASAPTFMLVSMRSLGFPSASPEADSKSICPPPSGEDEIRRNFDIARNIR